MMKRRFNIFLVFLSALSVSCGLADVNEYDDGQSRVNVVMDWSEVGDNHPESMCVFAAHTERELVMETVCPAEPVAWPAGEYMFLTFNRRDDIKVADTDDPELLSLSLPLHSGSGSGYVADAGEIYAASGIRTVGPQEETEVVLSPRSLTRRLVVRFSLDVADDIEVSGVTAGMSGIVCRVYPASGYVDYDDLHETVLSVNRVGETGNQYVYEASGRILGLFPAESGNATEGDGILSVEVSTDSYRGQKVFKAGINLLDIIKAENPMVYDGKTGGYVLAEKDIVLDIACVLELSGDGLTGDANDGVGEWFRKEDIFVEL